MSGKFIHELLVFSCIFWGNASIIHLNGIIPKKSVILEKPKLEHKFNKRKFVRLFHIIIALNEIC